MKDRRGAKEAHVVRSSRSSLSGCNEVYVKSRCWFWRWRMRIRYISLMNACWSWTFCGNHCTGLRYEVNGETYSHLQIPEWRLNCRECSPKMFSSSMQEKTHRKACRLMRVSLETWESTWRRWKQKVKMRRVSPRHWVGDVMIGNDSLVTSPAHDVGTEMIYHATESFLR